MTTTTKEAVVVIDHLHKSYGNIQAVKGISMQVERGEIFGFLGPNGAGKTTTVEILEGYRPRDGGTVEVLGRDPGRAGTDWRERIGIVLQSSSLYPNLTVEETLSVFAGYYAKPRAVGEVVELVGHEAGGEILHRLLYRQIAATLTGLRKAPR